MIIDSSAVLAILLAEPEAEAFAWAIQKDDVRLISSGTLLEAAMVIEARRGDIGAEALDSLVRKTEMEIVPFTSSQVGFARKAFRQYGRGRHPAKLNFGDCISYALAKDTGERLLCKGNDFLQTDIDVVDITECEHKDNLK